MMMKSPDEAILLTSRPIFFFGIVFLTRIPSDSLVDHVQHQHNQNLDQDEGAFYHPRAGISNPLSTHLHRLIFTKTSSSPSPTYPAPSAHPQFQAEPQQYQGRSHRSLRRYRGPFRRRCWSYRLWERESGSLGRTSGAVRRGNLHGFRRTTRVKKRFVRSHPPLSLPIFAPLRILNHVSSRDLADFLLTASSTKASAERPKP